MRAWGKHAFVAAGLAALAGGLGGCAGEVAEAADPAPTTAQVAAASPSVTPSPSPTPSRSTPPPPPPPRWTIECRFPDPTSRFDVDRVQTFFDLQSVWQYQEKSEACSAKYTGGGTYVATPGEQPVIDVLAPHWEGKETPQHTFEVALYTCAATGDAPETLPQLYAKAAKLLCPDSPTAAAMASVADGTTFVDGTYVVGDAGIAPDSYRTTEEARDCYWERTSSSGSTIANDFVTFAPGGAEVRVRAGEGFVSDGCGTWTKK